jgi:hypothetical protein
MSDIVQEEGDDNEGGEGVVLAATEVGVASPKCGERRGPSAPPTPRRCCRLLCPGRANPGHRRSSLALGSTWRKALGQLER